MKYLFPFLLLFSLLIAVGCEGNEKAEDEFLIDGVINNYSNQTVMLVESNIEKRIPLDSVRTDENGHFSFQGKAGKDLVYHIQMGKRAISIVPESDHLELEIDMEDIANYQVKGNTKSVILRDFTLRQMRLYGSYIRNKRALNLINKKTTLEKWRSQEARADKALMAYRHYLRTFADTIQFPVLASYALLSLNPEGNFYYLQEFLPKLRKRGGDSPYLDFAENTLAGLGAPFLRYQAQDIRTLNVAGDSIRLSDLKGKVVLLYFWASYCEFSRQENKRLVEAMTKHNESDFVIFSYSIDTDEAAWKQALEEDQLPGIYHARGDNAWDSGPFNFFDVESVPTTFLLGYRGILRSKNVRAGDILTRLPELMKRYGKPSASGS